MQERFGGSPGFMPRQQQQFGEFQQRFNSKSRRKDKSEVKNEDTKFQPMLINPHQNQMLSNLKLSLKKKRLHLRQELKKPL